MNEKGNISDSLVMLFCVALVIAFVFLLPKMNGMVRESEEYKKPVEKEKIPVMYKCIREDENESYKLHQIATYTIDEKKKIVKAEIHRDYQFVSQEAFDSFQLKNGGGSEISGQSDKIVYQESELTASRDIIKDIPNINKDDMEETFPRTYANLLVYTQDQQCSAIYDE